jgi:hypothetical protein
MKRTRVLRLVLLGGGVAAMVACDQKPADGTYRYACEQARAQNAPNAAEICARAATSHSSSTGYRSGFSSFLFGRSGYSRGYDWSGSRDTSTTGTSRRSGFGSIASAFSRSSGS